MDRTSIGRSQTSAGHLPPAAPGFLLPPQVSANCASISQGEHDPRRRRHDQPRVQHLGSSLQARHRATNSIPDQRTWARQRRARAEGGTTRLYLTFPHRTEAPSRGRQQQLRQQHHTGSNPLRAPGKPGLCKRQLPCDSTTARRGGVRASVRRKGIRNIRFAYRLGWPASARPPTPAGEPISLEPAGPFVFFLIPSAHAGPSPKELVLLYTDLMFVKFLYDMLHRPAPRVVPRASRRPPRFSSPLQVYYKLSHSK